MLQALEGRKTYIAAVCLIIYSLLGFFLGKETQDEAVKSVLEALAIAFLRAGIAKK